MKGEQAFTLIELLVSMLIFSILSSMALTQLMQSTRHSNDQEVRMEAEEIARSLLDIIVYDLRMAGSGMPLGQADFVANTGTLGDAPLPVLTSSDANTMTLRLNQKGSYAVLTEDFTPSLINDEFTVLSPHTLGVGESIYISNKRIGETEGLSGTIDYINGNDIRLGSGFVYSIAATFGKGSTVSRIDTITYDSTVNGITRNAGAGAIILENGSSVTFDYQNESGAVITLPLSDTEAANELATVHVNVSIPGLRALKNGSTYVATAEQSVALRNLMLSHP